MRKLSILFLFVIMTLSASAQSYKLDYEDISLGNDVFRTFGEWARVSIQTKERNALRFTSNVDRTVNRDTQKLEEKNIPKNVSALIYNERREGGNIIYDIMVRTDKKYAMREFTASNGYAQVVIPLHELSKKVGYYYRVFDPEDVKDGSCFQEHNVKGNQYFNNFKYTAAKEEYQLALQCTEAKQSEKAEAQQSIDNCNSIMYLIEQGNAKAESGEFEAAARLFESAYAMNPADRYLYNRYDYCSRNLNSMCAIYFQEAESNFMQKDYETARKLYQEVVNNGCDNQMDAERRIMQCDQLMRKRNMAERYFGLEFGKTVGFTWGGYSDNVDIYFTMRTNNAALELLRQEYNLKDLGKVDVSLGLSIPLLGKKLTNKLNAGIFKGVWLTVGAGVTACNRYQLNENLDGTTFTDSTGTLRTLNAESLTQQDVGDYLSSKNMGLSDNDEPMKAKDVLSPKYGVTVNGEVGLAVKVWHIALRATYTHRWAVADTKEYIGQLGKSQWSFGIGYCW